MVATIQDHHKNEHTNKIGGEMYWGKYYNQPGLIHISPASLVVGHRHPVHTLLY